jgi:hypothetical protein
VEQVTRQLLEENLIDSYGVRKIGIGALEGIGNLVAPTPWHPDFTQVVVLHGLTGVGGAGILTGIKAGDQLDNALLWQRAGFAVAA